MVCPFTKIRLISLCWFLTGILSVCDQRYLIIILVPLTVEWFYLTRDTMSNN